MSTGGKQVVLLTKTTFSLSVICTSQKDVSLAVLMLKAVPGHTCFCFRMASSAVAPFHFGLALLTLGCKVGPREGRFSVLLVKKDINK